MIYLQHNKTFQDKLEFRWVLVGVRVKACDDQVLRFCKYVTPGTIAVWRMT